MLSCGLRRRAGGGGHSERRRDDRVRRGRGLRKTCWRTRTNLWGCSSDAGVAFVAVGAGPRDEPEPPDGGFAARGRNPYFQKKERNPEKVIQSRFDLLCITLLSVLLISLWCKAGPGSGDKISQGWVQVLPPPPPAFIPPSGPLGSVPGGLAAPDGDADRREVVEEVHHRHHRWVQRRGHRRGPRGRGGGGAAPPPACIAEMSA